MNPADEALILTSLSAIANGPFVPDAEFQTLIGFNRDEIRQIVVGWPGTNADPRIDSLVNEALNTLLGYPHRRWDVWRELSPASPCELADLLRRWRREERFDFSPRGYFDRLWWKRPDQL